MNKDLAKIIKEEPFSLLFEAIPEAAALFTDAGEVLDMNSPACKLFGLNRNELAGLLVEDLLPDHFAATHLKLRQKYLADPQTRSIGANLELLAKGAEGREIPVEISLSPVIISGELVVITIIRDITEKKKINSLLTDYNEDLEIILNNKILTLKEEISVRKEAQAQSGKLSLAVAASPASVVITSDQGTIEYVNPKFTEVTGYSFEEALGQNPRILKSGKHPAKFYREMWDTLTSGREWHGEVCNKKKNGELYWELVSISPMLNKEGKTTHYVAVKENVTERRKVHKDLQREGAINASMAEISQALISYESIDDICRLILTHATRLTGSPLGYVGYINPEDQRLIVPAITEEAFPQKRMDQFKSDYAGSCGLWGLAISEGKSLLSNEAAADPRATGVPPGHMAINCFLSIPALINGKVVGQISLANAKKAYSDYDVKKTQRLADLLAAAIQAWNYRTGLKHAKDAAEAANRAKTDFLANIGHEIRTPMNSILGMTDLIMLDDQAGKYSKKLTAIRDAAKFLMVMFTDLLDFARMEAGRLKLTHEKFYLEPLLVSLKGFFLKIGRDKEIDLLYDITPGVPDALFGDQIRVRQVLFNLISNALKFTDSGNIVLHIRSTFQDKARVSMEFAVSDTGIGIDQDHMDLLFQSFVQVDGSASRKFGGIGLGLVICEKLVAMMDGKITVQSTPGEGSTFTVAADFHVDSEHGSIIPQKAASLAGTNILVAADNPLLINILQGLLTEFSCRVKPCTDASQTMHELKKGHFDLALVDAKMTASTDLPLTAQIRRKYTPATLPIILLTSGYPEDRPHDYDHLGIADFLNKPFLPIELIKSVTGVLNKSRSDEVPTPTKATSQAMPSQEVLSGPFSELATLLQKKNFLAASALTPLKKHLGESQYASVLIQLERELDRFEYEKGLRILEKLAKQLGLQL